MQISCASLYQKLLNTTDQETAQFWLCALIQVFGTRDASICHPISVRGTMVPLLGLLLCYNKWRWWH